MLIVLTAHAALWHCARNERFAQGEVSKRGIPREILQSRCFFEKFLFTSRNMFCIFLHLG